MGRRDLKSFHDFIVARQATEERYSKDLESAVKKALPPNVMCSLSTCYSDAKDAGSQIAIKHQEIAAVCKTIGGDLDKAIKDIKTIKTKLQDNYNKLNKEKESKKATHIKAKITYEECVKKAETATMSFSAGRSQAQGEKQLQKLESVVQSANKDLDKAHKSYITAVTECQGAQERFETETAAMLQQFQELENKRLAALEDAMRKYVQVHMSAKTALEQVSTFLIKSQSAINVPLDVHSFIVDTYTGNAPEPHVDYRPKTSEIIPHYGDAKAMQDSNAHMQATQTSHSFMMRNSGNAAASAYQPGASLAAGAAGGAFATASPASGAQFGTLPGGAAAGGAPASSGHKAIALYAFQGQEDGDLSFEPNDIVELIVHAEEEEWWQGSCRGVTGTFPRDYVKRLEAGDSGAAAAAPAAAPVPVQSFDAFMSDPNPAPEPVSAPAPAPAAGRPVIKSVRGLYDFNGEEKDELTFSAGEILSVFAEIDGWYEGALANGRTGIFPANYVEDI